MFVCETFHTCFDSMVNERDANRVSKIALRSVEKNLGKWKFYVIQSHILAL